MNIRPANQSPDGFAIVNSMELRSVLKAVENFRATKHDRIVRPALGAVLLVVKGTSLTAYASDAFMLGRVDHEAIHGSLNVAVYPDGLLSVLPSHATTTLSVQADGLMVATKSTRFLMRFPTYDNQAHTDTVAMPDYEGMWGRYSKKQDGASGGRFNADLIVKACRAFPRYVDVTISKSKQANTLLLEAGDPYTMRVQALLLGVVA